MDSPRESSPLVHVKAGNRYSQMEQRESSIYLFSGCPPQEAENKGQKGKNITAESTSSPGFPLG